MMADWQLEVVIEWKKIYGLVSKAEDVNRLLCLSLNILITANFQPDRQQNYGYLDRIQDLLTNKFHQISTFLPFGWEMLLVWSEGSSLWKTWTWTCSDESVTFILLSHISNTGHSAGHNCVLLYSLQLRPRLSMWRK